MFTLRRYPANKLLRNKVRGQAEKNAQKLSVEIYSVFAKSQRVLREQYESAPRE